MHCQRCRRNGGSFPRTVRVLSPSPEESMKRRIVSTRISPSESPLLSPRYGAWRKPLQPGSRPRYPAQSRSRDSEISGRDAGIRGPVPRDGTISATVSIRGDLQSHAAQAHLPVFRNPFQYVQITRDGNGEFHYVLIHVQSQQRGQNRTVTALPDPTCPPLVSPAQMHGHGHPFNAIHNLVHEIHAEVHLPFGVCVSSANAGIHEQTEMRIVELDCIGARVPEQQQFVPKDRLPAPA